PLPNSMINLSKKDKMAPNLNMENKIS
ncbi:dTDP-4-dehydrorhamnose 3,5-epimerase, partial [Escherichia coli]|nr:dTDP-4-dehydrorhamnose 3,5-epimerase [Escherichia coli]